MRKIERNMMNGIMAWELNWKKETLNQCQKDNNIQMKKIYRSECIEEINRMDMRRLTG